MTNFEELGIGADVVRAMKKMGWTEPTPVQVAAIPEGLGGGDLFAQAQTGTGKTGTYGSIILSRTGSGYRTPSAVVIVPTRELALQVSDELSKLARFTGHVCMPVYGGVSIENQSKQLKEGADIVVCTPGRAKDLLAKKSLQISKTSVVVLDEADRMLDMGFAKDLEYILSWMPRKRQTMLFSATMPDELKKLAMSKMKNPKEILVSKDEIVLDLTSQYYFETDKDSRKDALCTLLDREGQKTMVFCKTRRRASQLGKKMANDGYRCGILHGDVTQARRERTIAEFKNGTIRLLIATDVAARGLDIDDVGLVVNYDMTDPETYVHRIGRTGRAGMTGTAITFILDGELKEIRRVERMTGKPVERFELEIVHKEPQKAPANAQKSKNAPKPMLNSDKPAKSQEKAKKGTEKKKRFSKISIDVGSSDDVDKKDVCAFIKQCSGVEGADIGRIILGDRTTYVEVSPDKVDKVCKGASEYDVNGRPVHAKKCSDGKRE